MFPMSTHKGAVELEGLGTSVCCSRGREQEQYPSIPHSRRRHYKGAMVDTRRQNHAEVQTVTAVKRFGTRGVAVNPLHTFVLGVSKQQTIIQSEMPPVFVRVLQLQCLNKGINPKK